MGKLNSGTNSENTAMQRPTLGKRSSYSDMLRTGELSVSTDAALSACHLQLMKRRSQGEGSSKPSIENLRKRSVAQSGSEYLKKRPIKYASNETLRKPALHASNENFTRRPVTYASNENFRRPVSRASDDNMRRQISLRPSNEALKKRPPAISENLGKPGPQNRRLASVENSHSIMRRSRSLVDHNKLLHAEPADQSAQADPTLAPTELMPVVFAIHVDHSQS